jgi:hypothetical protein
MPHVPTLSRESDPTLDAMAEARGYTPNLYATLAHSPALLRDFVALIETTRTQLVLSAKLRELAILAIANETAG